VKAIAGKAYGSIPHILGSKRGTADKGLEETQSRWLTEKGPGGDRIIVQEKLDGSNVAIARIGGQVLSLVRRGYLAASSPFEMHHLFARWVEAQREKFEFLDEGHLLCGEWLAQAHSTRYVLPEGHGPFVVFDLITGRDKKNRPVRTSHDELTGQKIGIPSPHIVHDGGPLSTEKAMELLGQGGHGAIEKPEGAVWRLEREGQNILIAKFVRPDSEPGCLLPEVTGQGPVWNWKIPTQS
jgi:hypothetical protein